MLFPLPRTPFSRKSHTWLLLVILVSAHRSERPLDPHSHPQCKGAPLFFLAHSGVLFCPRTARQMRSVPAASAHARPPARPPAQAGTLSHSVPCPRLEDLSCDCARQGHTARPWQRRQAVTVWGRARFLITPRCPRPGPLWLQGQHWPGQCDRQTRRRPLVPRDHELLAVDVRSWPRGVVGPPVLGSSLAPLPRCPRSRDARDARWPRG